MILFYIVAGIFSAIMTGAALCACFKPGKDENICNYDNLED
jgi:hypothetical protein